MKNYLDQVERYLLNEPDPAFARRAGLIFSSLEELKTGSKILDAGCGRGFYLKVLSDTFPGLKLYGGFQ
jgi:cyclopropane fatty-acyl-phospholipid synthase-like methyltransferase